MDRYKNPSVASVESIAEKNNDLFIFEIPLSIVLACIHENISAYDTCLLMRLACDSILLELHTYKRSVFTAPIDYLPS